MVSRTSESLSEPRLLGAVVWEQLLEGGGELLQEVFETDTFVVDSTGFFTDVTGDLGFSCEPTGTIGAASFDDTVLNPGFSLAEASRVCCDSVLLLAEPDLLFSGV